MTVLMRSCSVLVLISVFATGCACGGNRVAASALPVLPGQGIEEGLFALKEMDMHLHAGLERPVPLNEWIDLAVADGRKVFIVLDHRELYDMPPDKYAAWLEENKLPKSYPTGREGQVALMKDLAGLSERRDVIAFRGWEIWEGELDEGVDLEAMRLAEVVGWHISPNSDVPPCGQTLLKRVRQIAQIQDRIPVPMIVFHPFSMRIERVVREAKEQGKTKADLTVKDYRFFQPGEQEELVGLLKGQSIYIEISRSTDRCLDDPVIREALIADIRPLAEAGVQFTVSTDSHGLKDVQTPFNPERYCSALGVTARNTNTIVRELLVLRAKRSLSSPASRMK